ncbi:CapA family protein [Gluconobacter wancherniae]|uniref:CapA family protein n=1 Tax=Gluconobacter wancherniae TaxID=1307955 RepID=UPI001B8CFBF6|nr:CapA family protein [Gluconobacter wancherniae]MBS1063856.1 CapA family protein [Gluconobacter wancherniae]MBS1095777.1 CapA family protein [Gluconobacter wancherniae]
MRPIRWRRRADEFLDASFDLFVSAKNHSLDCCISGLRKTMEPLNRREMLYADIGRHLSDACCPA